MSAEWQVKRLRLQMLIARARWALLYRRGLPPEAYAAYRRAIGKAEIAIALGDAPEPTRAQRTDGPSNREHGA